MEHYDVVIVGGGPAGLNAAMVLARCRRRVIVFDTNKPRNIRSHGMHNYLSRDGALPTDFLAIVRKEVIKYGVEIVAREIRKTYKTKNGYTVTDEDRVKYSCKKLLLATGVRDRVPEIEGFDHFYGSSIFHCPYCDGWEVKDKKLAVYAQKNGTELALSLKTWSNEVSLYTDGKKLKIDDQARLLANNVEIIITPMKRVSGEDYQLRLVHLEDGTSRECDALFFVNGFDQACNLVMEVGCEINRKGVVVTDKLGNTNVPNVFVAGDASKDVQFVVVAAAEGAKAGIAINKELQQEERK